MQALFLVKISKITNSIVSKTEGVLDGKWVKGFMHHKIYQILLTFCWIAPGRFYDITKPLSFGNPEEYFQFNIIRYANSIRALECPMQNFKILHISHIYMYILKYRICPIYDDQKYPYKKYTHRKIGHISLFISLHIYI